MGVSLIYLVRWFEKFEGGGKEEEEEGERKRRKTRRALEADLFFSFPY